MRLSFAVITVTVNGEPMELPEGTTIEELVQRHGLARQACAVEVNRRVVPRRQHAERSVAEGDLIELVTLVGGG